MALPKHLWVNSDQGMDDLQAFIDNEIAKKQEKERLKNDREKTRRLRNKMTIDEELEEDTKVDEPEEEYLLFYFRREKQIMEALHGQNWRTFLRHQDLPRADYEIVESRRSSATSSISTTRRMSIVSGMSGKARTIAPFLKAADKPKF